MLPIACFAMKTTQAGGCAVDGVGARTNVANGISHLEIGHTLNPAPNHRLEPCQNAFWYVKFGPIEAAEDNSAIMGLAKRKGLRSITMLAELGNDKKVGIRLPYLLQPNPIQRTIGTVDDSGRPLLMLVAVRQRRHGPSNVPTLT